MDENGDLEGQKRYNYLCSFYSTIVSVMLILCVTWTIVFPQELKFAITDAWLEEFDLSRTENKTLTYILGLKITIRNPNNKVGVYFDLVQVIAKYRGKRFASTTLRSSTPLYRGSRNVTLCAILRGRETVNFRQRDEEQYRLETSSRVYSIDVTLELVVRTKYRKIKSGQFKPPKIECGKLKVPLICNCGTTTRVYEDFKARACKNVFILFSPEIDDDF